MSNLSKELSGVILPHDHFGNHLDHNNNTIDEELELQNFEYAGERWRRGGEGESLH